MISKLKKTNAGENECKTIYEVKNLNIFDFENIILIIILTIMITQKQKNIIIFQELSVFYLEKKIIDYQEVFSLSTRKIMILL